MEITQNGSRERQLTAGISEEYRLLTAEEYKAFAAERADAWKDPSLPRRQYDMVVAEELMQFKRGEAILPYNVLHQCLKMLPPMERPRLLDVGCASGYYSDVLRLGRFECLYSGIDFSEHFIALAKTLFMGRFSVQDACDIQYPDGAFDIVLHAGCIMHIPNWTLAIREAARVSNRFVIFHRTPVCHEGTKFFAKSAYGIPCVENCFKVSDLFDAFRASGLNVIGQIQMFRDEIEDCGHTSYVCEKVQQPEPYSSNPNV